MTFGTRDAVVAFVYSLISRHLPAYAIEDILKEQNDFTITGMSAGWVFDNDNLGKYALATVEQLRLQTARMKLCTDCMVNSISDDEPLYCTKCFRPLCSHCARIVADEIRCEACMVGKDSIDSLGRSNIVDT